MTRSGYTEKLCVAVGDIAFAAPEEFIAVASESVRNNFDLLWTPLENVDHYLLEQRVSMTEWQTFQCSVAQKVHNGKNYQSCNIDVTGEDLVPELGKVVYRVSGCDINNICGNYQRVSFSLTSVILNMRTDLIGKPSVSH